jgi:hypothetical protein
MKAAVDFFVREQVFVEKRHALSRRSQLGQDYHFLVVEMGDELISIGTHGFDVGIELGLRELQRMQKTDEERILVCDDLPPIVLPSLIAEELAPLQHTDVQKISVGVHKELVVSNQLSLLPTGLVERQIAKKVTAEDSCSSKKLPTRHIGA